MAVKRLRKGKDKVLDGVCSGIAQYFDWDVSIVRLGYVLLGLIFPISMVIFYFIAMIVIPRY